MVETIKILYILLIMNFLKFFIFGLLIIGMSNLTILAKDNSHCLHKKYSQLKDINHVNPNKSCHSQKDEVAEICFNCECYYTHINLLRVHDVVDACVSNSFLSNLAFIFHSLSPRLIPPPPKLFS